MLAEPKDADSFTDSMIHYGELGYALAALGVIGRR